MEDVSHLALFAQQNWDISHSQCMEPGDNHCMEEAWFLVGQACDAAKFDPDLVAWNFDVSPNVCSLVFHVVHKPLLWQAVFRARRSRTCHKRHNGVTWRLNFLRFKVPQSLFPI